MGPRLSKNILEIQQIESGTLAKCWSDGRNVAKVIANLVQPFCQKQALLCFLPCVLSQYSLTAEGRKLFLYRSRFALIVCTLPLLSECVIVLFSGCVLSSMILLILLRSAKFNKKSVVVNSCLVILADFSRSLSTLF